MSGMIIPDRDRKGRIIQFQPAFKSKSVPEGDLFKRCHGMGSITLNPDEVGDIEFEIPYAWAKLEGVEILGQTEIIQAELFIEDDDVGIYSQIAPRQLLNQFGFEHYINKNYYEKKSSFDSDLYVGMWVVLQVTNTSNVAQTIYANIELNEVKV